MAAASTSLSVLQALGTTRLDQSNVLHTLVFPWFDITNTTEVDAAKLVDAAQQSRRAGQMIDDELYWCKLIRLTGHRDSRFRGKYFRIGGANGSLFATMSLVVFGSTKYERLLLKLVSNFLAEDAHLALVSEYLGLGSMSNIDLQNQIMNASQDRGWSAAGKTWEKYLSELADGSTTAICEAHIWAMVLMLGLSVVLLVLVDDGHVLGLRYHVKVEDVQLADDLSSRVQKASSGEFSRATVVGRQSRGRGIVLGRKGNNDFIFRLPVGVRSVDPWVELEDNCTQIGKSASVIQPEIPCEQVVSSLPIGWGLGLEQEEYCKFWHFLL